VTPYDTPERRDLRATVRRFVEREVVPNLDAWEHAGEVPRSVHKAAAAAGLLGLAFPERVGGGGGDLLDVVVVAEEVLAAGGSGGVIAALFTSGISLPHLVDVGTPEQVDRWVRPVLAGDAVSALAVTEPDGGSDVANLRTTARREGECYVLEGAKTFITSGCRADFVTVAVRTGEGLSLVVVERGTPGFTVSRRLDKMGWHCSDTAELAFDGCRVPVTNLVGPEGGAFPLLAAHFATERVMLAVQAYATAQRCLDLTVAWTRERQTFGRTLASRQVVRHTLVEMHRQVDVARTYVRHVAARAATGAATKSSDSSTDLVVAVAHAKNTAVAACAYVTDAAVQLHGGLGYMRGVEVERHYRDARVLGIGGGATEVLTDLAARRLGYAS
jgi:acyl-CoA dehydrogenase